MTLPDPETTPTLTVTEAAALLDVSRTTAYAAIKAGTWPTAVIRVGDNIIRIPTADLLRVLGHDAPLDLDGLSVTMGGSIIRSEPVDA